MQSRILYEDKEVLVVHKPAGIAVQTARVGQQDVVSELKNYLGRSGDSGMPPAQQEPYLGIIHRLDQPVEGLLVFAKARRSAASLTRQLQQGGDSLCKQYYAVLCGIPETKEGRLEDYLCRQAVKNGKHTDYKAVVTWAIFPSAPAESPQAQLAVLDYRILQTQAEKGLSLADIHIHTGRFHQIRAQMAHAGMPLLGDQKYGSEETLALARTLGIRNVALCAYRLGFAHPVSGKKLDFQIKPENPAFSSFSQL